MDWQRAAGQERRALQRIATLLMALADLAIRAAGAPLVVRCLVLFLLRHAEAVAARYAEDTASDFGFLVELPDSVDASTPEDAMRLAQSLHMLAQILLHLIGLLPEAIERHELCGGRPDPHPACSPRRSQNRAALLPRNHDPPVPLSPFPSGTVPNSTGARNLSRPLRICLRVRAIHPVKPIPALQGTIA